MSHGKSMDIETVFETCLMKFSPIRGKDLKKKIEERGYNLSRAQFYRYAQKLVESERLERINGIWYYKPPKEQKQQPGSTERAMLLDALIGYHEPIYFKKLPGET